MSFEPIDMPSKYSRYFSASSALVGSSHIMITVEPVLAALQAVRRQQLRHLARLLHGAHERHHDLARWWRVPMVSRTRLSARHSSSKQGRKASST